MNRFVTYLEKFSLTMKLLIGFSLGIVIALAIGLNALSSLTLLEAEMEKMYEYDVQGISSIKDANLNLIYMSRAMRHMLIAQDDMTRDAARAQIKRSREKLLIELAETRKRIFRPEVIARFEQFEKDLPKFLEGIDHAVSLIEKEKSNPSAAAQFITSAEFGVVVAKADGGLHELTNLKEKGAAVGLQRTRDVASRTRTVAMTMLAIGTAIGVLMGVLIARSIKIPNERLRSSVEELAAGKIDEQIPHTDYPNEIGVMARAIKVLQDIYRRSNEQHWVKSHSAEISSALQQTEDFLSLTQTAISRIAPVIGAGHAAFYVADKEDRYNLLASYGYRERKHLNNSFGVGEGLVGQCVMEKSTIFLTAPQNYIRINSGLGEGPPACIMVIPIIHSERVLGVLEVASFQQFTDRERAVLEALMPVLATSMEIMDRNLRTKELLAATQEQAERMEKQAAQLEEQSVEMEAQQAELLETESWFRSIIESAPDGMLVVDADGRILLSNPKAEKIFGYEIGELVGTAVGQLVPPATRVSHAEMRARFMLEGQSRPMGENINVAGLRKDGTEFPLTISLSPLPARGARGKCVSVSIRKT